MGSIDFAMRHACQILRDSGTTQDAAGSPIPNIVSTDSKCLFSKLSTSGNNILNTAAGPMLVTSVVIFLPITAVISEGDMVTTTEPHWEGTYEVQSIDAPEIPGTGIVDHVEAFLEEVAKRG